MKSRLFLLFAVCLVVAACGGESSETTTTTLAAGETTTSSVAETSTTGETATTAAETTTTTSVVASGGDDCLVGSWVLDDQAFFDQVFAADGETAGLGEVTSVSGAFTTTFDSSGSIEAVREDWGFSVATEDGTFKIVINGTQTGTWETDGSTLLLTLDEGDALDVEASVVIDGEEVALPSAPMEVPSEALATSSEFSCSGDEMSVISEGITSEFDRA